LGIISFEQPISLGMILNSSWIYGALVLGLLFISIFNLMAITAQKNGLSVVSVASKMSLVIPVALGVVLYNEVLRPRQIVGILLALAAVYCISVKTEEQKKLGKSLLFPLLVFLGSGIIEGALKYFENYHVQQSYIALFSACIFLFAALFGSIWIFGIQKQKLSQFKTKSIVAGILLGVVNYYSIYFLLQVLKLNWLNSGTVFTINNVSIVSLSSLIGFTLFRESISRLNLTGILLAVLSIFLISI
jgi:multidrug transporter EmrE-like cation transporter